LLIVATVEGEELHVTEVVKFWVLLSEYVPVAVNCSVAPWVIVGFTGVTLSDVRIGDTVSIVDPEIPFRLAWIVAFPGPTLVANPFEPPVLLIVATLEGEELHVTEVVKSWVLLSEYVPVALNCCVVLWLIVGPDGVTVIVERVGLDAPEEPPVGAVDVEQLPCSSTKSNRPARLAALPRNQNICLQHVLQPVLLTRLFRSDGS
jgi:hypothetical protein